MTFLDDSYPSYWTGTKSKPLSFSKTGSTDLRDTEVQQPNTTATLSFSSSSAAFSANNGQLEAGSTTTASSFFPSRPPFLFCSSIIMSTVSLSVVSLMAIVPDRECRMPTLIVSSASAAVDVSDTATAAVHVNQCFFFIVSVSCSCS